MSLTIGGAQYKQGKGTIQADGLGQEGPAAGGAQPQCRELEAGSSCTAIKTGRKDTELRHKSFPDLRKSQEFSDRRCI